MARSAKPPVIEHLFFKVKGYEKDGRLTDPVVTLDEVSEAIGYMNPSLEEMGLKALSANNPANFWKDLTRKNLARNWPASVRDAGFFGGDAIGLGDRACFRFVPLDELAPGAADELLEPSADALERIIALESLSMPIAMKALGRTDENWLAQVAARLRVIETHFATVSKFDAVEMTFLQTGIKLRRGEVDAAWSLTDGSGQQWLVAVEAKGRSEQVHIPQVQRAASYFLKQARERRLDVVGVLPMAMKVLSKSRIHVVEFAPDTGDGSDGIVVADSVIELHPHVSGIE